MLCLPPNYLNIIIRKIQKKSVNLQVITMYSNNILELITK